MCVFLDTQINNCTPTNVSTHIESKSPKAEKRRRRQRKPPPWNRAPSLSLHSAISYQEIIAPRHLPPQDCRSSHAKLSYRVALPDSPLSFSPKTACSVLLSAFFCCLICTSLAFYCSVDNELLFSTCFPSTSYLSDFFFSLSQFILPPFFLIVNYSPYILLCAISVIEY